MSASITVFIACMNSFFRCNHGAYGNAPTTKKKNEKKAFNAQKSTPITQYTKHTYSHNENKTKQKSTN